jgi:hypothetical protein
MKYRYPVNRCSHCGRYVGYKARWAYTPYDVNALEPPDEEYICTKCYEGLTEKDLALIKSIAWIPLRKIEVPVDLDKVL